MEWKEFEEITLAAQTKRAEIMRLKGEDYDKKDGDRLSSFKEVATILNVLQSEGRTDHTSVGVAEVLFVLKLVRDFNLQQSGANSNNESRADSQGDAHNYLDLRFALECDTCMNIVKG
tara:strand:+ start:8761 stop:9114 length:354 start_codon:yes stop_codon:yes gene_type:complete